MDQDHGLPAQTESAQAQADGTAPKGEGRHRRVALSLGVLLHPRHQGRQQEGARAALLQVLPATVRQEGTAGTDRQVAHTPGRADRAEVRQVRRPHP